MKEIISKELLSEVLGLSIIAVQRMLDKKNVLFVFDESCCNHIPRESAINIYELAHKCKEWAALKDYEIYSLEGFAGMNPQGGDGGSSYFLDEFHGESEPEAIFKACDYILKELSNK